MGARSDPAPTGRLQVYLVVLLKDARSGDRFL